MGVAAQYLIAECQFTVLDLTSIRLLGAGILLVLLDLVLHGTKNIKRVFEVTNLRDIVLYGLILMGSQSTFFFSIFHANAALATILVLTSPLFVIAYMVIAKHRPVKLLEVLALILALIGVLLLVTKGSIDAVEFSILGVLWGLASALMAAIATIQPGNVVRRLSVFPVIGWAMTFSGLIACLYNNPLETNVIWNTMSVLCYLHVVVFGTIVSFCCYLKSMQFISPPTASMLICFEPLSAVILSVILLGTIFTWIEMVGAVCILSTAILLARSK